jgi:hypothetical protein
MKYEYQVVHTALFSTPEDATAYVAAHKSTVGGMELKVAPYAAHISINEYQKPDSVTPVAISYTNIKP